MEQWTAFVVAAGMISFAAMISSIFKSMNKITPPANVPDPADITNKWDVIDEELIRLHEELGNYSSGDDEIELIMEQIGKLNDALAQKGE